MAVHMKQTLVEQGWSKPGERNKRRKTGRQVTNPRRAVTRIKKSGQGRLTSNDQEADRVAAKQEKTRQPQ